MGRLKIILLGFTGVAVIIAGIAVTQHMQKTADIKPAKDAVLAMTADPSQPPVDISSVSAPAEQPNIILIVADDMGWRDIGYNHSEIRTPTLDELAQTGVTLNRFYVQPACSPTRAALLTGQSPMRLGVVTPLSKNNPKGLPLSEKTLADRLKAVGYQTALTGKWHLGARDLAYHPNGRGFDHFYGHVTGGIGYYDKVHGGGYDWQRNGKTVREEGYTTTLIAQEAIKVIKQRTPDKPLFLYAAFGAPHLPNEAPESTIESYAAIADKKRQVHAAMVTEMDTAIGDIYAAVRAEGIEDNTLIWFMSDNGGLLADNPVRHLPAPIMSALLPLRMNVDVNPGFIEFALTNLRDGAANNDPFKGGKQSVSEGGVRVPALIHWPQQLDSLEYNHMTTVQDVMPTLLKIAGANEAQDNFDGRDLWAALNTNRPAPVKEYIVQTRQFSEIEAVYRYPYKLIENGDEKTLFNLAIDPLENDNIASDLPDVVRDMSNFLANFPRGESVTMPFQDIVDDIDTFGGVEDRLPWAEAAYRK